MSHLKSSRRDTSVGEEKNRVKVPRNKKRAERRNEEGDKESRPEMSATFRSNMNRAFR